MTQPVTYLFCLGATKAGTTWLHSQLSAHPDCHLRTIKEYHYFNKRAGAEFDSAIATLAATRKRYNEALAKRKGPRRVRPLARLRDMRAYEAVLASRQIEPAAFRDFLVEGIDDARLVADFTPAYSLLPEDDLRAMAAFAPDTRAIYLIRDPLDRLWSHVRMVASRIAPTRIAQEAQALMERIVAGETEGEAGAVTKRGDYATIIPKLTRAFGPKRLLVMFYEDLMTRAGFARVCRFLGIEEVTAEFDRRVHAGASVAMPGPLAVRARAFLRPQYDFVARTFPELPEAWRLNMNEA